MSRATVTVEGYVARDLELRRTGQGKAVTSITVPHQRSKRNQDGSWDNQGETTWWTATLWEEQAEQFAQLIRKGSHVIVTGIPEISTYQKSDGSTGVRSEILFATVGVIPRQQQRQQQGPPAESWNQPQSQQSQQQGGGWGGMQQGGGQQQDVWSTPGGTYDDETPF